MTELVYEGTWEEISRSAPELARRRLRVTVLVEEPEPEEEGPRLDVALAGLIGRVDSGKANGGAVSRFSEDESSFGEHLEQKRREGRL